MPPVICNGNGNDRRYIEQLMSKWYDDRGGGQNHSPSVNIPTSLDANAALPYGGVCSTERPEAVNVRCRIGGRVKLGKCGSTCRNVAGGISAVKAAARGASQLCEAWLGVRTIAEEAASSRGDGGMDVIELREKRGVGWGREGRRTNAARAVPAAPDFVKTHDPALPHHAFPGACALKDACELTR